jgi:hypothetical protein
MAFYRVVVGDKQYVNQSLFMAANSLGHAGTARAVAGGVKQITLFGELLYQVTEEHEPRYAQLAHRTKTQNIPDQLAALTKCTDKDRAIRVKIDKPKEEFPFGTMKFIPMSEMLYTSKYHLRSRMAVLQVCGSYYVALGARRKAEDKPVVILIQD